MPRKRPYARISITLPREVLAAADSQAKALDRPRSWVVAEAIRSYRGALPDQTAAPSGAPEVAAARRQHLLAGLLRLAPGASGRRRAQIIGFDSLEDFAAWKRARRVEGLNRS
jgi:hypothetical protein